MAGRGAKGGQSRWSKWRKGKVHVRVPPDEVLLDPLADRDEPEMQPRGTMTFCVFTQFHFVS